MNSQGNFDIRSLYEHQRLDTIPTLFCSYNFINKLYNFIPLLHYSASIRQTSDSLLLQYSIPIAICPWAVILTPVRHGCNNSSRFEAVLHILLSLRERRAVEEYLLRINITRRHSRETDHRSVTVTTLGWKFYGVLRSKINSHYRRSRLDR